MYLETRNGKVMNLESPEPQKVMFYISKVSTMSSVWVTFGNFGPKVVLWRACSNHPVVFDPATVVFVPEEAHPWIFGTCILLVCHVLMIFGSPGNKNINVVHLLK